MAFLQMPTVHFPTVDGGWVGWFGTCLGTTGPSLYRNLGLRTGWGKQGQGWDPLWGRARAKLLYRDPMWTEWHTHTHNWKHTLWQLHWWAVQYHTFSFNGSFGIYFYMQMIYIFSRYLSTVINYNNTCCTKYQFACTQGIIVLESSI